MNILISYWYFRKKNLREELKSLELKDVHLFADSGAFSAYSLGGHVNREQYADWLYENLDLFDTYVNLDVKGDVQAGLDNFAYLESRGLKPLPVYHAGEPWSVLEDFIKDYPYIALGGIAGFRYSTSTCLRWLIKVFRAGQGKSTFHGFGMTSWKLVLSLPWRSVDSSSWASGTRYGNCPVFDNATGLMKFAEFSKVASVRKISRAIEAMGFDPSKYIEDRRSRELWDRKVALGIMSHIHAEIYHQKRWGHERKIRVYIATPSFNFFCRQILEKWPKEAQEFYTTIGASC